MWYIYPAEFYSVVKEFEIYRKMGRIGKKKMLGEVTQAQRDKRHVFSFICRFCGFSSSALELGCL